VVVVGRGEAAHARYLRHSPPPQMEATIFIQSNSFSRFGYFTHHLLYLSMTFLLRVPFPLSLPDTPNIGWSISTWLLDIVWNRLRPFFSQVVVPALHPVNFFFCLSPLSSPVRPWIHCHPQQRLRPPSPFLLPVPVIPSQQVLPRPTSPLFLHLSSSFSFHILSSC